MGSSQSSERDPITTSSFTIDEGFTEGAVRARAPKLEEDSFKLARAEVEPDGPVFFERSEGQKLYDLVGTERAVLNLVSPRFLEALEGFSGWTTFPIEFEGADGYALLAITGRAGPIDDSLSERIVEPPPVPEGEETESFKGLYFRAGTWDGSDVYTSEDRASIFMTADVKEALGAAGVTNVDFEPLSENVRMVLDDDDEDDEDDE